MSKSTQQNHTQTVAIHWLIALKLKINMKKTLKIISTVSILLFGILLILNKFDFLTESNSTDFMNILVLVYLFTSLKYFQMEVKDKNAEIQELKLKLEKTKK